MAKQKADDESAVLWSHDDFVRLSKDNEDLGNQVSMLRKSLEQTTQRLQALEERLVNIDFGETILPSSVAADVSLAAVYQCALNASIHAIINAQPTAMLNDSRVRESMMRKAFDLAELGLAESIRRVGVARAKSNA